MIKKHKTLTKNPSIKVCVNKIENNIRFKFKRECYFELSSPGTVELL